MNKENLNEVIQMYYTQYINNYQILNMEFQEFVGGKLKITDNAALRAIKNWKEEKELVTNY